MHDLTKNGHWFLKVSVKFDLDRYGNPSSRQGKTGVGVYENFSVASEEEQFKLNLGNLIEKENMGKDDPMHTSRGRNFTTEDRDNDNFYYDNDHDYSSAHPEWHDNSAYKFEGGWWHDRYTWFCANCQFTNWQNFYFFDGGYERPSAYAMWMRQEIDD